MAIKKILLLGNDLLYKRSIPVKAEEKAMLSSLYDDLLDTLLDFRSKNGFGRAIAAVQIGVLKRVILLAIDQPLLIINPVLSAKSRQKIELWDNCLSFPGLLVKVKRSKTVRLTFRDRNWSKQEMILNDDLAELVEHEYDHLNGILAVQRALDRYSFAFKPD